MSDLTPYPRIVQLEEYDAIAGIFAYIIEDYGQTGLCCRVGRTPDNTATTIDIGDWAGKKWTPSDPLMGSFIQKHLQLLLELIAALKLPIAEFYFVAAAGEFTLVDMRLSSSKFVSPGMLEELFGKVFRIQNTIDKATLTPEMLTSIRSGVGKYAGSLIIKPNRYRTMHVEGETLPFYIRVLR